MKITLYHNSACSKSRAAFEILEKEKISFDVVEYLTHPPTEAVLDQLLTALALNPEQIVRTGEDEYEQMEREKKIPQTRKEWLKALVQHPILIERPIVTDGKTAVMGRPPERISEWLKQFR